MSTFPSLQPQAKLTLVQAVEEHLNHVIATAVSVSRKCKRARLLCGGGGSGDPHHHPQHFQHHHRTKLHTRLHASDIHLALQMHGQPRLFGHSSNVSMSSSTGGGVKESTVLRLKDVVQAETLLEPPMEIAAHYNWLAVDGEAVDPFVGPGLADQSGGLGLGVGVGGGLKSGGTVGNGSINASNNNNNNNSSSSNNNNAVVSPTVALDDSASHVQIDRMIQSGLLSEELKLYYQRITTGLEEPVIANLAVTTGIQEIVPFLVRFAVETLFDALATTTTPTMTTTTGPQKQELARTMIRILHSLLSNVGLHLELQLHQMVPALVTTCVAELADHHRCKLDAASALALMVRLYGNSYPTLAARITSVLAQAVLEPMSMIMNNNNMNSPVPDPATAGRVYGGLVGLTALGAVGAFGHVIAQFWDVWDAECQQVALSSTAVVESLPVRAVLGDRCVVHDTTVTNGYAHCFV
jgi:hypothetical protein